MHFTYSNYPNSDDGFPINNNNGSELNHDISEMLINKNYSNIGADDEYDDDEEEDNNDNDNDNDDEDDEDEIGEAGEEEEDCEDDGTLDKTSRLTGHSMDMEYTNSFIDINFDPAVTTPTITPTTTSQSKRQNANVTSKNKIARTKWKISEDIALLNVIINNSHLLTFIEYIKPMKIFWNKISKLLSQSNQVTRNSRQCHDRFKVLYFKAKKFKSTFDKEFDPTNNKKKSNKCENKRDLTDLQKLLLVLLDMFRFNNGNIILNPLNNSLFDPSNLADNNNMITSLQLNTSPTINQNTLDLSKRNNNPSVPVLLTPNESTRSQSNSSGFPHSIMKNPVSTTTDLLSERNVQRLNEEDIQSKVHRDTNGLTMTDLGLLSSNNNSSMKISSQLSRINNDQANLKQEIIECENRVDSKLNQYEHKIGQFDKSFDVQASNVSQLKFQVETKIRKHKQKLDSHGQQLDSHGQQLDSHGQQLDSHGQQLDSHGQQLDSHGQQLEKHDQDIKQQNQMLLDGHQHLTEQRNTLENQRLQNNNMYNNIFRLIDGLKNEVNTLKGEVKWLATEVETMKDKNQEQALLLEKVHSLSNNYFSFPSNRHFSSVSVNMPANTTHTNVINENKSSSSSENGFPESTTC